MFSCLGEELQTFCHQAERELLLVAPFIKLDAFERLMVGVDAKIKINCVTRWRPDEVAAGISDIEIWRILEAREYATLWLRNDLHAKYYRADECCLIGSANITSTALGWARFPNYELLIPVPKNAHLIQFEEMLFGGCTEVDQAIFDQIKVAAESIPTPDVQASSDLQRSSLLSPSMNSIASLEAWIPGLRTPEKLFVAYQRDLEDLTLAAREAAILDLEFLNIPIGLNRDQFEKYVGAILLQAPIIKKVDRFVEVPRRFGEVKRLLHRSLCANSNPDFDAASAWQTLMRWLLYFLPERYKLTVPSHSEVFQRVK